MTKSELDELRRLKAALEQIKFETRFSDKTEALRIIRTIAHEALAKGGDDGLQDFPRT